METKRELRRLKMDAISRIRKVLLDGELVENLNFSEWISYLDGIITEEISKLCCSPLVQGDGGKE